jgi:hypothetical protein
METKIKGRIESGFYCTRCKKHTDKDIYTDENGYLIQECLLCHRKRRMYFDDGKDPFSVDIHIHKNYLKFNSEKHEKQTQ